VRDTKEDPAALLLELGQLREQNRLLAVAGILLQQRLDLADRFVLGPERGLVDVTLELLLLSLVTVAGRADFCPVVGCK
jgi:hypothetical protein